MFFWHGVAVDMSQEHTCYKIVKLDKYAYHVCPDTVPQPFGQ
jgi:hypothetical protein